MRLPPQLTRIWQMVMHAKGVLLSPTTPLYVKIALVAGVLYVLSPYDLIPEWVPILGVMDDVALVALLITWANRFSLPGKT